MFFLWLYVRATLERAVSTNRMLILATKKLRTSIFHFLSSYGKLWPNGQKVTSLNEVFYLCYPHFFWWHRNTLWLEDKAEKDFLLSEMTKTSFYAWFLQFKWPQCRSSPRSQFRLLSTCPHLGAPAKSLSVKTREPASHCTCTVMGKLTAGICPMRLVAMRRRSQP